MKRIDELDLPYLPVDQKDFAANPYPPLAVARQKHPWLASSPIGYYVHEYSAMKELLVQDEKLRAPFDNIVEMMNAKGTPWGRFTEQQMIAHSGESHERIRNIFAPRFTPRQADSLRQLMQSVITELLDEWAPKKQFDFAEFASCFPVVIIATMVGAPREAIPELKSSLEALGQAFGMDPSLTPTLQKSIQILDQFVHQLMAERLAQADQEPRQDLLQLMIDASNEGNMSDRELADMLIFLLVAGYDTSKNVLTHTMHLMVEHPDIYERCAEDKAYCQKVIEESLRYLSPATNFRITIQDIEFRDTVIPENSMLFFPLSISGRDPGFCDNPDTFDPERAHGENRHIAFGRGVHMCLGQYIARAQLQEGLHLIAQRIKNPKHAGPISWRPFPGAWGMSTLPIEFTPG